MPETAETSATIGTKTKEEMHATAQMQATLGTPANT